MSNYEEALLRELERREEAKIHMASFVPYVTEGELIPAPHHRVICDALDRAVRGQSRRIIIAAPPAHAKSVYSSYNFPAFWLGNHPRDKIIAASHTQPFAAETGRKVRNLVATEKYTELFEMKVSPDSRAADRWETTAGGQYYTTGVNGTVVGRRANLILIDDPYKSKEIAYSATERKKISDWYFTDVVPRLLPNGVIVVIATRWHEDDLTGQILKKSERGEIEPFELISLTAICEDPANDPMGRSYGEALWPSQYPVSKLREIEGGMNNTDEWDALYQQRPRPAETGEIRQEWFQRYDTLPDEPFLKVASWDTAGTTGQRSDYTVGIAACIGLRSRNIYLTDMYRNKATFPVLMQDVPRFNARHETNAVLIENKGTGTSLIQVLRNSMNTNIIPIMPQKIGDKEFRFELCVPMLEAGKVFIPRKAPWIAQFLEEVLTFPSAVHDDIVDALTQLLNHYRMRSGGRRLAPLKGA